jgi:hypothetical protein
VSSNGGLSAGAAVSPGYAAKAPYQVTLNLVSTGGGQTANQTCAAETLTAGSSCTFAGQAAADRGLRLAAASTGQSGSYLRVSAPAYSGSSALVAGAYADTLTVTVSISP